MGLSRRFLNLIVNDSIPGVRSLRCIDLARNEFFYPDTPLSSAASTMEQIRLPSPTWSFKTSGIVSCSTLSDRKVFCAGRCGDAFIYDADTRRVVTMPTINRPKWEPISIFVPSASAGAGAGDGESDPDGTLFVMERRPKQEGLRSGRRSDQFEAFVYRRSSKTSPSKSWHHQSLPLPPFLFLRGHGSQKRTGATSTRSDPTACLAVAPISSYRPKASRPTSQKDLFATPWPPSLTAWTQ